VCYACKNEHNQTARRQHDKSLVNTKIFIPKRASSICGAKNLSLLTAVAALATSLALLQAGAAAHCAPDTGVSFKTIDSKLGI
jgi:hypothetical protein